MRTLRAAIFDLDGVILDTESQYNKVWGRIGKLFHPEVPDFSMRIKGLTLNKIFDEWFSENDEQRDEVYKILYDFEAQEMVYRYVEGADAYLKGLRRRGIPTAVATSSNEQKMSDVRRSLPEMFDLFDYIVTADKISNSKPNPECFLLAAQELGVLAEQCAVYEDSINGLKAARASGAYVVGLSTTYPKERVCPMSDIVIRNFTDDKVDEIPYR